MFMKAKLNAMCLLWYQMLSPSKRAGAGLVLPPWSGAPGLLHRPPSHPAGPPGQPHPDQWNKICVGGWGVELLVSKFFQGF